MVEAYQILRTAAESVQKRFHHNCETRRKTVAARDSSPPPQHLVKKAQVLLRHCVGKKLVVKHKGIKGTLLVVGCFSNLAPPTEKCFNLENVYCA